MRPRGLIPGCALTGAAARPDCRRSRSDHVREGAFRLAEIPDAGHEQERDGDKRERETLRWKWRLRVGDGPAEAIDHADHGIEGIEQPPFLGDDVAAETNR